VAKTKGAEHPARGDDPAGTDGLDETAWKVLNAAGRPFACRPGYRTSEACRLVDAFVLATTRNAQDDPLEALGRESGIAVFRGSENDLVDRYYQAARECSADVIVGFLLTTRFPNRWRLIGSSNTIWRAEMISRQIIPMSLTMAIRMGLAPKCINMEALTKVGRPV
jgi:hypothetical protein